MSDSHQTLFVYERWPHKRRHGPMGYTDYKSYKPWLRDEFVFRCVFCLYRERWSPEGDAAFSVEHFQPQSSSSDLVCDYHNLLLACCACNSAKREILISINPCDTPMAEHIEIVSDGTAVSLTNEGLELIEICHLNRNKLREYRERMIQLWELLSSLEEEKSSELKVRHFGYPDDLPDLCSLRPPGGNSIPGSEKDCYFERRRRGELQSTY